MPPRPKCSLVVCTRNRADRLASTLERIVSIRSRHEWELVVVDNGSSDPTEAVVQRFVGEEANRVRYVSEPIPGLSRARNRGCAAAEGRIVAFIDDDCYPESDYVDAVVGTFARHSVGYVGGRILPYEEGASQMNVRAEEDPELIPAGTLPRVGVIQGGNMALRSELLDDVGGFDEKLGLGTPYPCEDIEICARASHRGWHGGYFPEPTVHHHHRPPAGSAGEEAIRRGYEAGIGAYYAKCLIDYPSLRKQALKWWYWNSSSARRGRVRREVLAAVRYALGRLTTAASRRGGFG